VSAFKAGDFDSAKIRCHADGFGKDTFKNKMRAYIDKRLG